MNSQAQVIGKPRMRTWQDYREGCLDTYAGGHHEEKLLAAFRHGMETVFNLLEKEFPQPDELTRLRKVNGELVRALELALRNEESRLYMLPASDDYEVSCQKDILSSAIGHYREALKNSKEAI